MQGQRNFGLDLTRATAISMVYLAHEVRALNSLVIGVDLFFALSGFLIGRIYFSSQASPTYSVWRFWRSRWWRTLPPYFAALGLAMLLGLRFANPISDVPWYYIFFLQNYLGVKGMGVTWSLCVEEHFYLLLPILGGLIIRTIGRKHLIWLLPLAALIPQAMRLLYVSKIRLQQDWYQITHFHSEGLVLGVFLAYLFVDHPRLWQRIRPVALVLSLLPIVIQIIQNIHPITALRLEGGIFLYYALGFASWVRVAHDLNWSPTNMISGLLKKSIQGLAICSYSVYLLHTLFFTDIRILVEGWPRGLFKSMFILISTFLLSLVFYFLVERPSILTRDRYLRRRKPITVSVPPVRLQRLSDHGRPTIPTTDSKKNSRPEKPAMRQ